MRSAAPARPRSAVSRLKHKGLAKNTVVVATAPQSSKSSAEQALTPPKKKRNAPKSKARLWWQIGFYTAVGLTVGFFTAGGVTAYKVIQTEDKLTSYAEEVSHQDPSADWPYSGNICGEPDLNNKAKNLCNKGELYERMSHAFYATGVVTAVGALVFSYFAFIKDYPQEKTTAGRSGEPKTQNTPIRVSVNGQVGPQYGGVELSLSF
jgi:hypothetical protein